jgi:pimeloyl-ACP methyl ester carboxylesterase
MSDHHHTISTQDIFLGSPRGRLFVRTWSGPKPCAGAPIVLLHDSLGSVDLWRNFPERLCAATGRTVHAYDRLGFGKSDAFAGKLPLNFVARESTTDFAWIAQQLGLSKFVVLGHSVGGGMATHIAAHHNAACVALVTESAQAFVEDRTIEGIKQARDAFKDAEQLNRLARYHGDKAPWVLNAWITTWLSPEFAQWSLSPVLPAVQCPVLAIHGANDEYGSIRHPEIIASGVKGPSRIEIVPDTQHVPHREKESHVVDLVANFLEGQR